MSKVMKIYQYTKKPHKKGKYIDLDNVQSIKIDSYEYLIINPFLITGSSFIKLKITLTNGEIVHCGPEEKIFPREDVISIKII